MGARVYSSAYARSRGIAIIDAIAATENARLLKEEFGDRVTVVEIPNSGHAMLPEQPELIAEAIIKFLKSE